jgi:hypothetical protein
MATEGRETDFVFNVVMTPGTFRYLQLFTRTLLAQSAGRLRLVSNGCAPEEVQAMREFAAGHGGRVEVTPLAGSAMIPHGAALDEVYGLHDDGKYFCFVDSDVKARRPFMGMFVDLLTGVDVVTSCNVAWADDSILPPGASDLVGRHAVGHDGFVYGSSYLAIYARAAVERVRARWAITFRATSYEKLDRSVQEQLAGMDRRFGLYDTAKVLNILLQAEGFTIAHADNPALVHIGGISQYLSDPTVRRRTPTAGTNETGTTGDAVPWHSKSGLGRTRWDFAQWTAAMLRSLVDGEPAPDLPDDVQQRERAAAVRRELLDLAGR